VYWANEKSRETKVDENGIAITALDFVAVHWNENGIAWDNEFGDPCAIERINVVSEDVENHLLRDKHPFADARVQDQEPAPREDRTGLPGRPGSSHRILPELRRRAAQGRLCPTLAEEARELCHWHEREHPTKATPKPLSTENLIRK